MAKPKRPRAIVGGPPPDPFTSLCMAAITIAVCGALRIHGLCEAAQILKHP